jgi:hypothetical protein
MTTLGGDPKPSSARAGAEAPAVRKQGNRKRKPGKASRAAKHKRPTNLERNYD